MKKIDEILREMYQEVSSSNIEAKVKKCSPVSFLRVQSRILNGFSMLLSDFENALTSWEDGKKIKYELSPDQERKIAEIVEKNMKIVQDYFTELKDEDEDEYEDGEEEDDEVVVMPPHMRLKAILAKREEE